MSYTQHPGIFYTPVSHSIFNEEAQNYQPVYASYNSAKMPVYSTLDITLNRVASLNNTQLVLFATITNVLNNKNKVETIYSSDYTTVKDYGYSGRLFYFGVQFQFGHFKFYIKNIELDKYRNKQHYNKIINVNCPHLLFLSETFDLSRGFAVYPKCKNIIQVHPL